MGLRGDLPERREREVGLPGAELRVEAHHERPERRGAVPERDDAQPGAEEADEDGHEHARGSREREGHRSNLEGVAADPMEAGAWRVERGEARLSQRSSDLAIKGTTPTIVVPLPGAERTSIVPPRASSRSAMPCSPVA